MGRMRKTSETQTYHAMARGNNRQAIFHDDFDRARFVALLGDTVQARSWLGYAYCLMGNHFHLLVTTPTANLADGMRDLLATYARRHNARYERSGHLFTGRFHTVPVKNDVQLLTVIRYIARNPVRAGLVGDPNDWPWSSSSRILRGSAPPPGIAVDRLLSLFHPLPARARGRFAELIARTDDAFERPSVRTLIQIFGEARGISAAASVGYTQAEIAVALGVGRTAITKRLRPAR